MQRRNFLVNTLLAIPAFTIASCKTLQVPQATGLVIRSGKSRFGVPTPFKGINPNDLKISTKDTHGKLSAFEYIGFEKAGPSYHKHPEQDELFYVVEGDYLFQLGTEKKMLHTGDLIFLPRDIPHTWIQTTAQGKLFYMVQPAGKMEEFFVQMTERGGKASAEEMTQISVSHGIINVGPPLSATEQYPLTEGNLTHGFIVRAGQWRSGGAIKLNGVSPNDLKISGKDTGGELAVFEYHGKEKGGPPLHIHPHQDEIFYITAGKYLFQCGTEQFELVPGDTIFLPRGVAHAFAQLSEEGKMFYFFQPAGKMEEFFSALGQITGAPDPEAGARLFKDHDMEIVGPPLRY